MKKIGFIDYFIDEWHANNYPIWIKESKLGKDFEVAFAYEMIHPEGKTHIDEWCKNFGVQKCDTIEELVEKSDCIIVLSPDNSEMHEELSQIPLKSGKPTYIDKTFAPSYKEAKRIIDLAVANNTPMYSTSALRFSDQIVNMDTEKFNRNTIDFVSTRGSGVLHIYVIHQVEMVVRLMGVGAKSVTNIGTKAAPVFSIDYKDGRKAVINMTKFAPYSFMVQNKDETGFVVDGVSRHFENFIDAMLEFFNTEKSPVPFEETLECMALIEACCKVYEMPPYSTIDLDDCK